MNIKKIFLDLLFPIRCLGCNKIHSAFLCNECLQTIPSGYRLVPEQFGPMDRLLVAAPYNHPLVRKAIHAYKYGFVKDLSAQLGQLMKDTLKKTNLKNKDSCFVPVPLARQRLRWRGFNQADCLANYLGNAFDIPALHLLQRVKNTQAQVKINGSSQRKKNVQNAFCLRRKSDLKNKTAVIIDDVCTTGATLQECAKIIRGLQPKAVWGLVIARNVKTLDLEH